MHDDEIGIGANHRKTAVQRIPQQRLVILNAVVPTCRSRIEDELRFLRRFDEFKTEPFADLRVALGADMQASPAKCRIKRIVAPVEALPSFFTRGHDIVVKPGGTPTAVMRRRRRRLAVAHWTAARCACPASISSEGSRWLPGSGRHRHGSRPRDRE